MSTRTFVAEEPRGPTRRMPVADKSRLSSVNSLPSSVRTVTV